MSIRSARSLASVLMVSLCVLCGCADESPQALLASAKTYLAQGRWEAAVIQLKNALQKNPKSTEARFLLGKAFLEEENPAAALIEFGKAAELGLSEDELVPATARALLLQGEVKKVTSAYATKALRSPLAVADLKTSLAVAFAVQRQPDDAQAALEAALKAAPDFSPAMLLQARHFASEGNVEGALELTNRILAKAPNEYGALVYRGELLLDAKNDAQGALDAFGKAMAVRRDGVGAYRGAILAHLARHDVKSAKAMLAALKEVRPRHPQTRSVEAAVALQEGNLRAADELTQLALRAAPDDVFALELAGRVAERSGALLQAEQHLTKVLQINPRATDARRSLAQIYLRSGRHAEALGTLQPLLADHPDAQTLALAAAAHLQGGDSAKAEELYAQARKLDPSDARIGTALAMARLDRGEAAAALGDLEAIANSNDGTVADFALLRAQLRRRDIAGALQSIDHIEKKQPTKPVAPWVRGRVLLIKGDVDGARRSFEQALSRDAAYFPAVQSLADLDVRDKKPEQAERRFEALLKSQPNQVQALVALARLRERAGRSTQEVSGLLTKAVAANPGDAGARVALVTYWLAKKDTKAALAAAQAAVAAQPDNPRIITLLARVQLAAGDVNQSIASFGKVVAMQPGAVQPLLDLADAYAASKNDAAAAETLRKAMAAAPSLLAPQQKMLALAMKRGLVNDALAIARTLQKQPANAAAGHVLEGDIQAARRSWTPAIAAYRTALQKDPSTNVAERLHSTLNAAGDQAGADALAADWLKAHPDDAHFLFHLGSAAIARGDYKGAEIRLTRAVELQPDNPAAQNNLAWILLKLKKPQALEHARRANDLAPQQPNLIDTLAMALAEQGNLAEAIEWQKRAVALDANNHALRLSLVKLYMRAGDNPAARRELQTLARAGDRFAGHKEVQELSSKL